jgi:hypothetical protein
MLDRIQGHHTLERIQQAFPDGLDYRDAAWMMRRCLEALWFVHSRNQVHGAVLPPHVMVNLENHGAKIVDWSYAVRSGEPLKAVPAAWRDLYPPEVFDRAPAGPHLDIYLLGQTMTRLLGGTRPEALPDSVPAPVQALIQEMTNDAPNMRWQSAGDLWDEFDKTMQDLVGKPKFRRLELPK